MMKKMGLFVLAMALGLFTGMLVLAEAQEDVQKHPSCKYCGMNRQQFAHSRVFIEYDDASTVGTCSIHCAAVDLAINIDKMPKAIQVGDYNSKALIDAEKASWVIGGSKMGVMTKRASGLSRKRRMLKSLSWRMVERTPHLMSP
jgi:nitrous oxide reductase accessory protein NosL